MEIFESIGYFTDNKIYKGYYLVSTSAKKLSNYLKELYSKKGIDLNSHNGNKGYRYSFGKSNNTEEKPPHAIYEYQNFFLMENEKGEFVLLDGFRRLLWYDAPDVPITVRVYEQSKLTNTDILTLLTDLNHFKFYGGGSYHERGFSLLLKTVFDLNIHDYMNAFDGYLYGTKTVHDYGTRETSQNNYDVVKERITNKFFISDINFIRELNDNGFLADRFVGATIYEHRSKSDKEFDVNSFISYLKDNKTLTDLMVKYEKIGTDNSAKSIDIVNKILGIYDNAFTLIEGGNIELSYAEKLDECKEAVKKLKKDKSLIKLTGSQKVYLIDRELEKRIIKQNEEVEFVFVVFPNESNHNPFNKELAKLEHGIYTENIKYIRTHKHLLKTTHYYGFLYNGEHELQFMHNYSGYDGHGKKYTRLEAFNNRKIKLEHKVEVFARLPKEILKR